MLNDRFRRCFNHSYLSSSKRGASLICKALLKYGYAGFRLEILEYCPISIVLDREQFYIDKLNPEYNILKIAGSSQGFKHSPKTISKLRKMQAGKLHPRFNTKASDQQKLLTSLALKKYLLEHGHHNKGKKGKLSTQYGIGGTKLIMTNELGETISFPSINSARLHFRVRFTTISKNMNKSIIIKGVKWSIATKTDSYNIYPTETRTDLGNDGQD